MGTNDKRLDRYFANITARRRSMADWRIYAAVTGSALAMATNASAGVIYFNQAVAVGPVSNVGMGGSIEESQDIALKSAMGGNIGFDFRVSVFQYSASTGGVRSGYAFISASVLVTAAHSKVKKLSPGANISTASGIWDSGQAKLAFQHPPAVGSGWAPNATAVAGFRFSTRIIRWTTAGCGFPRANEPSGQQHHGDGVGLRSDGRTRHVRRDRSVHT